MGTNFVQIVRDQMSERDRFRSSKWVPRDIEKQLSVESRLVQVITGVRRSGKSTLAHRALQNLHYAYVNFDDERLAGLIAKDLDLMLESLYMVYGEFSYLLLDEIQNVENWHLFVNRLHRTGIHIVLTGSNSKLLSSELATHLTGRYALVELLPFAFTEFLEFKGKTSSAVTTAKERGLLGNLFGDYMQTGGFPDILLGEQQSVYIKNLFEAIITKDIFYRHKIRQIRAFRETAYFVTSNFTSPLSFNRLSHLFSLGSENTAKNYISYLEEAFLIFTLEKFSYKNQEGVRNRKVYLVDPAFSRVSGLQFSENSGRILENIVFLELYRRSKLNGSELFFYKNVVEVDFVVFANRKVLELIQVCTSVQDERVLKREVRALTSAAKELGAGKLTIITLDQKTEVVKDDRKISVLPVWEWMLV
jgi:predicted AAA+ superfamily ATPase